MNRRSSCLHRKGWSRAAFGCFGTQPLCNPAYVQPPTFGVFTWELLCSPFLPCRALFAASKSCLRVRSKRPQVGWPYGRKQRRESPLNLGMHRPLFSKDGLQTLRHFIVLNSTKDNAPLAGTGLLRSNHLHERQKVLPVRPTRTALFCQRTWQVANGKLSYQRWGRPPAAHEQQKCCAGLLMPQVPDA